MKISCCAVNFDSISHDSVAGYAADGGPHVEISKEDVDVACRIDCGILALLQYHMLHQEKSMI